MTPVQIGAGFVIIGTFLGGAWLGWDWRDARAGREQADQARAVVAQMDRAMERRAAADQALAGVQSAVQAALRRPNAAPPKPIPCPASGDVRDAVLPGLAERLRAIDAAAGDGAGAGVAPVPGPGPRDPTR